MKYIIQLNLNGKESRICVDYQKITSVTESGFEALKLPFDVNKCVGYPMLHAYIETDGLYGYERYCGWIQVIERREYSAVDMECPDNISFELDVADEMREAGIPYFAYGYPAEFFDAPCMNLNGSEKLKWRAYTYLVDMPLRRNGNKMGFLAGFSWGYVEDINGNVGLLDFKVLGEDEWGEHRKYALFVE